MSWRQEGDVPEGGDWISMREAASLWSDLTGREMAPERLRRWCREEDERVAILDVWHIGDRYLIERQSMLRQFEDDARRTLEVVERERRRDEDERG